VSCQISVHRVGQRLARGRQGSWQQCAAVYRHSLRRLNTINDSQKKKKKNSNRLKTEDKRQKTTPSTTKTLPHISFIHSFTPFAPCITQTTLPNSIHFSSRPNDTSQWHTLLIPSKRHFPTASHIPPRRHQRHLPQRH